MTKHCYVCLFEIGTKWSDMWCHFMEPLWLQGVNDPLCYFSLFWPERLFVVLKLGTVSSNILGLAGQFWIWRHSWKYLAFPYWVALKATTGGLWSSSPPSLQTLFHWSNPITNLWECIMGVPLSWQYAVSEAHHFLWCSMPAPPWKILGDPTIHFHKFVMELLQWHKVW